jgi:CubicO group peptidase (beta-lactamase class C family)
MRMMLTTLAMLASFLLALPQTPQAQLVDRTPDVSLDPVLQPYLARYDLPAVAAAVVRNGTVVAAGAVGTRRAGTDSPVTVNDRFHIGSDTKAMTALLAATFVEEGRLRWDSKVGEVFPELAATMDAGLRRVTLEQLLSHTSGIPSDNETFGRLLDQSFTQEGNLDELRYWLVKEWSRQPLQSEPGTQFAYSNMGYTMAGAMLERVAGKTWEELVVTRIFEPLSLRSAGFGPQASLGRVDAPLGHVARSDGTLKPMLAGPNGDNPVIIGPAGTVHLSLLDFAAWAGWNAGEGRRGPALVRPETLRKLHGRGARIRDAGAMTPTPFWAHAMRADSGRPSSSMRFRTWTATSISVARRSSVRERSPSPITRLNRPTVASARARAL